MQASFNCSKVLLLLFDKGLFSSHKNSITIKAAKLKKILIQKGAYIPRKE